MRPPITRAATIASGLARVARAAEKNATQANQAQVAAAVSQLKKVKRANKASVPDEEGSTAREKDVSESPRYKNLATYRNAYTYYPHQDFPLGDSLSKALGGQKSVGPAGKDKYPDTVDVVSPALCDDILNYLGPDLDKYKGCDIIDIHPGACLWSQKIHQYLKPRRHLLLEPDVRYLDSFINPLLEQKDSAYRHTTLSGAHPKDYFETYDKIFNDHLLPKRDPLPANDPRLREPNNSLLVIGSLVRRYGGIRLASNAVHFPNLILLQMAEYAQTNNMFQRYGLVRALLWTPDEIKATVMPDSILAKLGYSVNIESAFDLAEVVNGDRSQLSRIDANKKTSNRHRQHELDLWGARRVLARMKENDMVLPEHRRPELHKQAIEADDESLDAYNPIRLPEAKPIQELMAGHEDQIKRLEQLAALPKKRGLKITTLEPRCKLTSTSQAALNAPEQHFCRLCMDVWGVQIALEQEYAANKANMTEDTLASLEPRLIATSDRLHRIPAQLFSKVTLKTMIIILDEIFALCKAKPMMAWDRRPYEAIVAKDEEFWPRFPMQLLDLKPRQEALGDDLMGTIESNQIRRSLAKALFTHSAAPLVESIDRLGPGAREFLVGPAFKDARLGGRLDPNLLLTRDITVELLNALTRAYIDWPFRPEGLDAIETKEIETGAAASV
ncbi:S-adenosyl-L-methionine-dependent methyltransferase [Aureobasidium subglaciale]|nr:S-adenosyl-L-methionine-dependent methyltransferase [Aureobasidium subglaciale]